MIGTYAKSFKFFTHMQQNAYGISLAKGPNKDYTKVSPAQGMTLGRADRNCSLARALRNRSHIGRLLLKKKQDLKSFSYQESFAARTSSDRAEHTYKVIASQWQTIAVVIRAGTNPNRTEVGLRIKVIIGTGIKRQHYNSRPHCTGR